MNGIEKLRQTLERAGIPLGPSLERQTWFVIAYRDRKLKLIGKGHCKEMALDDAAVNDNHSLHDSICVGGIPDPDRTWGQLTYWMADNFNIIGAESLRLRRQLVAELTGERE